MAKRQRNYNAITRKGPMPEDLRTMVADGYYVRRAVSQYPAARNRVTRRLFNAAPIHESREKNPTVPLARGQPDLKNPPASKAARSERYRPELTLD